MNGVTSIGRTTTIRGSVRGEGDLEIQGRVDGEVTVTGELIIGDGAIIKSSVSARRVVVRGAVAGNVTADESVVLEPGARVVGDLGAPQIGIRPGALVRGNVSTGNAPPRAARASAAAGRAPVRTGAPARPPARAASPAASASASEDGRGRGGEASKPRAAGPPPPIVPTLKKGARASFKRKGAR